MLIRVKSEGKKFFIPIPNCLLLNRLSVLIAHKQLKKHGIDIPQKKLYALVKVIRRYKWRHPKWTLVEVHSSDGDDVEIKM